MPLYTYIVSLISATILVLVNQKYTQKKMGDILNNIDWEIIFYFISLFIIIGCLLKEGFLEFFNYIPFEDFDPFVIDLLLLLIISFFSGLIANTPITIIFLPIISSLKLIILVLVKSIYCLRL
ncbi:MAG: hypothetical protein JXA99_01465 [Candidatus Lokiarchaeota archaeon]|nr:hypothetical protein [Candidatus Lokiarchaeota archaeon]